MSNDIASKLTGKNLQDATENQIKSELKLFIKDNGGEDFLIDDDLITLIELAAIYSDVTDIDAKIADVQAEQNNQPLPTYKRVGCVLRTADPKHKKIVEKIAELICNFHLDLTFVIKDKGIALIDATNAVFTFENLRQIEGMSTEYSGIVTLSNIKTDEELQKVVSPQYYRDKTWDFLGRLKRCEGKYFTVTELLDLVADRKIITFDRYE